MQYYLKIGGESIPNVSALVVSDFYRNETRRTTFSGGESVDRGTLKLRLYARIRSANLSQMKALEEKLSGIIVTTEFYYRGELVEKKMIASTIPKYVVDYPNGSEEEPYYREIEFNMEEQ